MHRPVVDSSEDSSVSVGRSEHRRIVVDLVRPNPLATTPELSVAELATSAGRCRTMAAFGIVWALLVLWWAWNAIT
jgi:hypothetical protein